MKLILSSCDFGNPKSAAFIKKHLCKPLADNRVLSFPNEKATREKIERGKYENRLISFGFQKKNISIFNYYDPDTFGLTDYSGLGLFEGILLCHYTEERASDLTFLKNHSKYRAIPLKDTDSILIHDN